MAVGSSTLETVKPAAALAALALLACSQPPTAAPPRLAPTPAARPGATIAPTPIPTPPLPANYLESLRGRNRHAGQITVGEPMWRGSGFTKLQVSWTSGGQTMTGTISLPDGAGPFPVVVVNHGFIPPERYWIGQDSGIFGDPMAAHGFISVAPNCPGYSGSGPAPADLPSIVGQVATALDPVSSLSTL